MNRAFGKRAVRYIAEQGIRQFIDLGSGITTTPPSVHDAVHSVDPTAHVVYVDVDPMVVAHSHALRSIDPGLTTILADVRQPETVLDHPDLQAHIDFNEPEGCQYSGAVAVGSGDTYQSGLKRWLGSGILGGRDAALDVFDLLPGGRLAVPAGS
jgi:hypothetical protein